MCVRVPQQMQLQFATQVDEKQFHYAMLKSARSTRNCALCPTTIRAANAAGNMPLYAAGAGLTQALTAAGLCTAWDACPACCVNENAGRNGGDTGYIKSGTRPARVPSSHISRLRQLVLTQALYPFRFLQSSPRSLQQWLSTARYELRLMPATLRLTSVTTTLTAQRIFVVGIANGGFLAARLACDMPQLFAGVLVYAAGFDAAQCTAVDRVPMLMMQGDADVIVPYLGGVNSAGIAFPGFEASVSSWGARNQCRVSTPHSFNVTGGPREDKYTILATEFAPCSTGASVTAWRIIGGQHFALQATSVVLFSKALDRLMSR